MSDYGGSIASNPRVAVVDLTLGGQIWLWVAFAIMASSALAVTVWAHSLPSGRRAFHFTTAVVLTTASIAYFTMASDLGATPVVVEFDRQTSMTYIGDATPVTRSIWYVRYVDWAITTPSLLLTLLLATGMPTSLIIWTVFVDLVMIITGLIGALVASTYKWGFFTFGCVAMFYVFWVLIGPARRYARALSPEAERAYTRSALFLAALWFVYPIIWAIADGGNVISTDLEMALYGALDILAKPVFTFVHLFAIHSIPYESFALQSGHFSAGVGHRGHSMDEKRALNGSNGITDHPADRRSSVSGHPADGHGLAPTAATSHPNAMQTVEQRGVTHSTPGQGVVSHTLA